LRLEPFLNCCTEAKGRSGIGSAGKARSLFSRRAWRPAVIRAGIPGITFHGLRHSFVAILVAAGCNVREVSEWAGHNNVAFTLTRYGGLFERF
jgi:integrase